MLRVVNLTHPAPSFEIIFVLVECNRVSTWSGDESAKWGSKVVQQCSGYVFHDVLQRVDTLE